MKFVDLSVVINEEIPAYPGDPRFAIKQIGFFDKDTYNDHQIKFGIHSSGTHIDAPWHMVEDGAKLADLPIDKFVGNGKLIDVKEGRFDIRAIKESDISEDDIVIFNTGMAEFYGKDNDKYYGDNRPEMSEEVARYLASKKVKMIGLDMCSPDKPPFKAHRVLLGAEVLIIENLTNLKNLSGKKFKIYALPLKLALDGAPARVIAQIE